MKYIVKIILEYKRVDFQEYFLVKWNDGSITWSKASNLNCKTLICNFFINCLNYLNQKAKIKNDLEKKNYENEILKRIIESNSNSIEQIKINTNYKQIINEITEKYKSNYFISKSNLDLKPEFKSPQKIYNFKNHELLNKFIIRKNELKTKNEFEINNKHFLLTNGNIVRFIYKKNIIGELMFHYNKNEPNSFVDIEKDSVFVPFKILYSYLYQENLKKTCIFQAIKITEKIKTDFFILLESTMTTNNNAMIYINNNKFFVLYFNSKTQNLFKMINTPKIILFCVENYEFLKNIYECENLELNKSFWLKNKYESTLIQFSKYLFNGPKSFIEKPTFYIGDKNTYTGKHVMCFIKNYGEEANEFKPGYNILIHNSYYNYIDQIDCFNSFLKDNNNFYGIEKFTFVNIYFNIGILTLSENFVKNCILNDVLNLFTKLEFNKNWILILNKKISEILISRFNLTKHVFNSHILNNMFKFIKKSTVDLPIFLFLNFLKKMAWDKKAKYLCCIGNNELLNDFISLEDILKIID